MGKNLDYWVGNLQLGDRDMVGDCQQGNWGEPSAAALEEDSNLLVEAVVDNLQAVASGNQQRAVEGN